MITDADIEKLKTIFVTKSELKESITKAIDASTTTIVKEFRILLDMFSEQSIKIDQTNSNLAQTNKRLDDAIGEIRTHRIAFGEYERRMEHVESHIFRQT